MADEKIKFDKWSTVEDALKKSAVESESKTSRLVFLLVCQAWNPPSLHLAKECEKMRSAKVPILKSPLFILDHDDDKNKTYELGITATPALFAYVGSQLLTIRRPAFADDTEFVGSCSKENLLEILQAAGTAENDASKILELGF